MNCSECSNPLTPNAKFCKSCGARQSSSAAPTAPIEKICGQCHAVCKPQARFCTRCGTVFDASTSLAPAQAVPLPPTLATPTEPEVQVVQPVPAATIFSRAEPPLIEAVDLPASPHPTSSTPAYSPIFPQEPAPNSKSWIKWVALVLIIAAIAGGVLMANNMKALSGANSTPTASQTDKSAMSPEDKAKADALVGPQGINTSSPKDTVVPLNDESSVTIAPVVQTVTPPTSNPVLLPPPPVLLPQPPAASAATSVAVPSRPNPPRVQPIKKNAPPSLDDLLD